MPDDAIVPGAGADGGGTAIAEPTPEPEPSPTPEPTPEPAPEPTPEPEPKPGEPKPGEEPVIETDGRKIDAATRTALAEIKKTNPTAAKALKDAYFGNQAILKEVPEAKSATDVIKAIRGMTATLDAIGGETGIQDLQTEVTDYRTEIKQFSEGDPALLNTLYEANPESLATAGTNLIALLDSKNGDLYARVIAPEVHKQIEIAGVYGDFVKVVDFIKEGKGQEAYDLALKIGKWFGAVRDQAKKITEGRSAAKPDPEREALQREREELNREKESTYTKAAGLNVDRLNNTEISKLTGPLARELKLSADGRADFENGLRSRIWKKMAADKVYVQRAQALRNKGDMEKHVRFIHNKFVELLQDEFENYRNIRYPNMGVKPKPKPAPAAGNGAKPHVVTSQPGQRPKSSDVDWSKTPDVMWITGRAVLLNGQSVKFDPNSPPNKF
jgi:hypothetical protein